MLEIFDKFLLENSFLKMKNFWCTFRSKSTGFSTLLRSNHKINTSHYDDFLTADTVVDILDEL